MGLGGVQYIIWLIRENITPIGDGNKNWKINQCFKRIFKIRENITPIGDGNHKLLFFVL